MWLLMSKRGTYVSRRWRSKVNVSQPLCSLRSLALRVSVGRQQGAEEVKMKRDRSDQSEARRGCRCGSTAAA